MERLTRKINNEYTWKTCYLDCIPKLGKLEDLEEQIGMSLLEFLNLIGKDIYVIASESYEYYSDGVSYGYYNNAYEMFKEELHDYPHKETISFLYENGIVYNCYESHYYYPTKELGLSWFLTREEAEKKLEEMKNEN